VIDGDEVIATVTKIPGLPDQSLAASGFDALDQGSVPQSLHIRIRVGVAKNAGGWSGAKLCRRA
jgi:hypothetical protein